LNSELFSQSRAELFIGAGDRELVPAPRLRTAGRNSAGKRRDHAGNFGSGLLRAFGSQQGRVDVAAQKPEVSPHQTVAESEAAFDTEFAAENRDDPHLAVKAHVAELPAVAEKGDLAAQLQPGVGVEQVEAGARRARQHVLADAHQQRALESFDALFAKA